MKRAGIIIMIIGLVMAIYTGFNYVTREKVIEVGELKIMANKKHRLDWSPVVGALIIVLGGGLYLFGSKKTMA